MREMRARVTSRTEPELTALLVEICDRLSHIESLLIEQRLPSRGARDEEDVALLRAIAESVGGRVFTSAQLIVHADADPALRAALRAADIDAPHDLGTLFRRLHGVTIAGLRLERDADSRDGALWAVRVCDGDPRTIAETDTA